MRIADLKNKRLALWGLGREGNSSFRAIKSHLPDQEIEIIEEAEGKPKITADKLADFEIVVLTPGVSIYREEIVEAKKRGVTFTTHGNLWFAENPEAFTICITGTKGKSTTSSLIHHLLKGFGKRAVLGGNIGIPLFDLPKENIEYYVIELSSYQIATLQARPSLVVLTNLYPEHLDWHRSQEQYFEDKSRLLYLNKNAIQIVSAEDPITQRYLKGGISPVFFGGRDGINYKNGDVFEGESNLFSAKDLKLIGNHNFQNLCAAVTVVKSLGLAYKECDQHLASFTPLPHRLTVVGENDGLTYINDSISTIPEAAIAALNALDGKNITILLGGYDRGVNLDDFAIKLIDIGVKNIITMGQSGKRLREKLLSLQSLHGANSPVIVEAQNLKDAVDKAKVLTKRPGIILLSPASPSYGEFKNFEERGDLFTIYSGC